MRKYYITLPLVLTSLLCLLVVACIKDDSLADKDGDLFRKSFPVIDNLNVVPFSTGATTNFNISEVEPNDTIQEKEILVWHRDEDPTDTLRFPVIPVENNFGMVDGLTPGTAYSSQVVVFTSDDVNRRFTSPVYDFETTKLTVLVDGFVEDEQKLKVTAFGFIEKYDQIDPDSIKSVGFLWSVLNDNNDVVDVIEIKSSEEVTSGGLFKAELRFFDYSKIYSVEAIVELVDGDIVPSAPVKFETESKGDFWVNIGNLKSFDNELNQEGELPFFDVPGLAALEGAVGFELGGFLYMGLGRSGNDASDYQYPVDFYKYDPLRNKWAKDASFPQDKGRMYAVSSRVGDKVYVGTGCNPCEGYDGYDGNNGLDQILEIGFLEDFYRFDGTSWELASSLPSGAGSFGAYAFSSGMNPAGQIFVGGGLEKGIIEGDINIQVNEAGRIDPREWHDFIDDGIQTPRALFVPEITLTETEVCGLLAGGGSSIFCTDCACVDQDCENKENIVFRITSSGPPGYSIQLVGDQTNTIYIGTGASYSSPAIEIEIIVDGATYTWLDKNTDGIIDNTDNTPQDEVAGLSTAMVSSIRIEHNGAPVWTKGTTQFNTVVISLDYDTFWCDQDNDGFVDKAEELFYNTTQPNYDEWIDDNGNRVADDDELSFGLRVKDDLYRFDQSNWSRINGNNDNRRYGAVTWQLNQPYLVAGSATVPFSRQNPLAILQFTGNNWGAGAASDDFEPRVHPLSFVIEIDGNRKGYVGGGEKEDGKALSLELWEYDETAALFKQVSGCGVNSLKRGVGLAFKDKGYVIGKSEDGTSTVFWCYVPKLK